MGWWCADDADAPPTFGTPRPLWNILLRPGHKFRRGFLVFRDEALGQAAGVLVIGRVEDRLEFVRDAALHVMAFARSAADETSNVARARQETPPYAPPSILRGHR